MKNIFKVGDIKTYKTKVSKTDIAAFHGEPVHNVCSTFALARDMEWSSRLFVLEMKEADEEGIGTALSISHQGPAFPGEDVVFCATIKSIEENTIICTIEVTSGERKIAVGETGQKILPKEKLEQYFLNLKDK